MLRSSNVMLDRLGSPPPRCVMPVAFSPLLQLPDELLVRVLHELVNDDGTQKAENLRNLCNV